MTLFIKPQNGGELRNANVIIGYLDGMAIIENEYGKRFFVECEPEQMPIGTYVDNNTIVPVTELDKSVQCLITEIFGKGGDY